MELRDRIAAALRMKYLASDELHNHAADAVIETLGLTVEAGVIVGCLHD